jgi:hypothetical protein
MSELGDCALLDLPVIKDPRGCLSFIESSRQIPFDIRRVYYIYDISSGACRGGHAHRALHQLMVAMSGSFEVSLDDGHSKKMFMLNRPDVGLYIPPMIWRELNSFSGGSVCMVLASDFYFESDYYRNYEEFLREVRLR